MEITVDDIWQLRIHHGVRYQKSEVPFPASVKIGLDFNAALERKEKLDLSLLTNGVVMELCNFATAVTKSESYFLFDMLEYNFDLGVGVDNDLLCYKYSKLLHNKIKVLKDQIKTKPQRRKETFLLPELGPITASASEPAGCFYRKRSTTVDCSVLTKKSQSAERQKTEINEASSIVKRDGRFKLKAYPLCRDLGVTLVVRPDDAPKEKLDRSLVTSGVMLELLDFARVLCGTHVGIIHDLIKQNFGEELDRMLFRMEINKLVEKKSVLSAKDREALLKEAFPVQIKKPEQKCKKRKNPDADDQEPEGLAVASKRRDTLSSRDDNPEDICQDSSLSYMCPVEFETEMQSDLESGPKFSLDVKEEEEEVFVSGAPPHTNVLDRRLLHVRPKNTTLKSVSDLFSEDKSEGTNAKTHKQKLWMRRATRSKQILKSSKVNDLFAHCRETGLDFNVGSGNKQNVDLQLFTNHVLLEVFKFATAMTKSLQRFLLDIMDNNFNLVLQDELRERNLLYYMMTKEKIIQNHPDVEKTEFLNSPFQFPEVYNVVDVTGDFQAGQEVETEQQTNGDSPASAASQQADTERHPFCTKLGLNLWSTGRPANQKLDLSALTTGAVLEIFGLVRELCGSACETVNDVLEHNFDLDLQSGATEASQVIQKWYATQRSLMKGHPKSPKITRWLNAVVPVNCPAQLSPQSPAANSPEELDSEDVKPETEALGGDDEPEEKRVNSYRICEEMGLSLNVVSKPEPKKKLDLRLLTRGTLFEIHQYVEQNCNRYVPALYEILSYNFDLSSQNHRRVEFAWAIASQVIAIARKNGREGDYLSKVIELPVESSQVVCKEEPEDVFGERDPGDNNDILFVRELKPVDIEVIVE